MGSNITGLSDIVGDGKTSAIFYLLADRMAYLMSGNAEEVLSKRTVRIRRKINKLIKMVGPLFLERKQVFESKNALMGIDEPDKPVELLAEAVIWCPNHGFKDDVLATVLASRHASVDNAKRVMDMGADLLMYPEGVWNKTPDKLILNLWPGVVADPISMDGLPEEEGLELLRDTMATWYYLMMEKYGKSTCRELLEGFDSADAAWDSYIAMHTGKVAFYDSEIELKADYRPRDISRPEDVWRPIASIKRITAANASHVTYAQRMVLREEYRDFQRKY